MRSILVVCLLVFGFSGCSFGPEESSIEQSSRTPQGLGSAFRSVKRLTVDNVANGLKNTGEFITEEAIEKIGRIYIRKLPLDREVEKDIIRMLEDDDYVKRMIPFLKYMRDNYSFPKGHEKHSFRSYAIRNKSELDVPGSEHKLFQWDEEKEEEKKNERSLFNQKMIAKIVEVYHNIFVKYRSGAMDPEEVFKPYKMMTKETVDLEVLESVKPIVASILKEVLSGAAESAEGATKEAVDGFLAMIEGYETPVDSPNAKDKEIIAAKTRFEALTISLIDFVGSIAHKSYRIYLSNFIIRGLVKSHIYSYIHKMRDGDFTAGHPMENLYNYAKFEEIGKNYAMQIAVDGLQKKLVKSISQIEQPNSFIKTVMADHKELKNKKLINGSGKSPEEEQDHNFLEHALAQKGYSSHAYMRFFKKLFSNGNDIGVARRGVSTTPTISVRNLPIIFTGARPAGKNGTGLPNFHFVDREKDRAYYFFGNDALQLDSLTTQAGMITQFERFRDLGIQTMNCNAQYDWAANNTLDALVNLGLGEASRDFGEKLCYFNLMKRAENEKKLRKVWRNLQNLALESKKGVFWKPQWVIREQMRATTKDELLPLLGESLPEYVLWYNPWPDHFAHFYGPFADEITGTTGELNRLDYWIQKMTEVYKVAGVEHKTLFGIAGDHGLAPIYKYINPEVTVLEQFQKDTGRDLKILKISSDEGEGPKLNNALFPDSAKGFDVIIASTAGGNYMMDFFLGQDEKRWKRQPTFKQLSAMPLLSGGEPVNWIMHLKTKLKNSLDYMVTRERICPDDEDYKECTDKKQFIVVSGYRDGKFYDEKIFRFGSKIFYKPSKGDLLGLKKISPKYNTDLEGNKRIYAELYNKCISSTAMIKTGSWCTVTDWDHLSSYTDRPGSVVQLANLYNSDLAGTVNLFPKYGVGYNTKVPGRHAGESFHEKDAMTGIWGAPLNGFDESIESAINGSVAPSIFEWVSGEKVEADGKLRFGFGYAPIIPMATEN